MKARSWLITINYKDANSLEDIDLEPSQIISILEIKQGDLVCGQVERGELGTLHWQIYVRFKSARHLSALSKLLPRAHWERTRREDSETTLRCVNYSTKSDTYVGRRFRYPPEDGNPDQGTKLTASKLLSLSPIEALTLSP